jgi:hypothetical protein
MKQLDYHDSDLTDEEIQRHMKQEEEKAEQEKRDIREKWKKAKRFSGW